MALLWIATTGWILIFTLIIQCAFYLVLYKHGKLGKGHGDFGGFFEIIIEYPNLSYRDKDYVCFICIMCSFYISSSCIMQVSLSTAIQVFGVFVLWTPFAHLFKDWDNVTIFYTSRFTENLIFLAISYFLAPPSVYVTYALIAAAVCNVYTVTMYFYRIRRFLNNMEIELNLDIWGVLKHGATEIDMLRRYIKRAPATILYINKGTVSLFMFITKIDLVFR